MSVCAHLRGARDRHLINGRTMYKTVNRKYVSQFMIGYEIYHSLQQIYMISPFGLPFSNKQTNNLMNIGSRRVLLEASWKCETQITPKVCSDHSPNWWYFPPLGPSVSFFKKSQLPPTHSGCQLQVRCGQEKWKGRRCPGRRHVPLTRTSDTSPLCHTILTLNFLAMEDTSKAGHKPTLK